MSRFVLALLAVAIFSLAPAPRKDVQRRAMEPPSAVPMTAAGIEISPRFILPNGSAHPPASFVNKVAFYNNHLYLGTFDDGIFSVAATPAELDQHPERLREAMHVPAPMRMVNDVAATRDTLIVAANEGLFFSRDGSQFERLDRVARGATGIAISGDHVFVTTTSALWRIRLRAGKQPRIDGNWWLPAGSRALQGITLSGNVAWLASEDRGVICFDPSANVPTFGAVDRLSGAPSSWVIAVAGDAQGGVFAATLRDGVFHVDRINQPEFERITAVPDPWSESVSFDDGILCVGSQAGAACWKDWHQAPSQVFAPLPDGRVHAIARLGNAYLLGTEGGIALAGIP
ncbi:MAG: hypothetical protein ABI461_19175 [Polyangiaceae bacterium]